MNRISSQQMYTDNFQRLMVIIAVMMAAMIEVLDMTIVSVALPHMMGSFGANSEQITWVVTSYVVSSAIVMLMTGFVTERFGSKRILFIGISGFLISSMLCGLSSSLAMMVIFRVLQGTFGAVLVPLSQLIVQAAFPKEDQPKAMAIWGMGIMVAPILGPTLGGYITDVANWRWIFYINIPVCVIAMLMIKQYVRETPRSKRAFDWMGMALMAIGVGALQIFLDRGNSGGWFDSQSVKITFYISIVFLLAFIIRGVGRRKNILRFSIFKDRNFVLGTTMMAVFCGGFFGIVTIQPIMLEKLMNYSATYAGLVTVPRGITSAIGMATVAVLIKRVDPRWLIGIGVVIAAYTSYLLSTLSLTVGFSTLAWISAIQGISTGMFFVPLGTAAFATMTPREAAEGTGVFSFSRNLGISIGTALLGTVISRQSQTNWNRLGGHISPYNHNLTLWLHSQHLTIHSPMAIGRLAQTLQSQASMIAYVDGYWAVAIGFAILLPFVFIMKFDKQSYGG